MSDHLQFQLSDNAAENYERYSAVMLDPFIEVMMAHTAPQAGMSLLDVACGTGRVARRAWSVMDGVGDIHGLDLNAGMLSTAAALAAEEGRDITWHEGPAESMPLPANRFDVTICSMGVMFFTDLAGGLGEMVRVTKPGGRLLVVVFGPVGRNPYMAAQAGRLDGFIDAPVTQGLDNACRLRPGDIAAPLGDLAVSDIAGDTVELDVTIPQLADYLAVHVGGLPFAEAFQALPDDAQRDYYTQVEADLAAFRTADGAWSVPFTLHFVSAVAAPDGSSER